MRQPPKKSLEEIFGTPPESPVETARPQLGTKEKVVGATRSLLGQGLGFGFGEEAEALVRSLAGGRPYPELKQEIRGEMEQFRRAYPVGAPALEIAGGFAIPGGAVKGAAKGAIAAGKPALARALGRGALAGAKGGALTGVGTAQGAPGEPDAFTQRLMGGLIGGATGAVAGGVIGGAGERIASRLKRKGKFDEQAAYLGQTLAEADMTPAAFTQEASRLSRVAPAARVMDVLPEEVGLREAMGLYGKGGRAAREIREPMQERFALRPERLQESITRATGRGAEDIFESAEDIIRRRAIQAEEMYKAVREQPPVQSQELERLFGERPALQAAMREARVTIANAGGKLRMMDTPEGPMPERTPEFLDYIKRNLDDKINSDRISAQDRVALTKLRGEFVDILDDAIPGYREAREVFKGETDLLRALETGRTRALGGRTDARQVAKEMAELSEGERELFQNGYIDGLRSRVDAGELRPQAIRTPRFRNTLTAIFGEEQGNVVYEALDADAKIMEAAGKILAGARTAPMQQDILRQTFGEQPITQAGRSVTQPFEALWRGLGAIESTQGRRIGAATRLARSQVQMTPASQIGPLLSRLATEEMAQGAGRQTSRRLGGAVGTSAGQRAVRSIFGPREEP